MLGKGHGGLYKLQQWKKEESERLRGERDQIKFINVGFERWQVVRFRKVRGKQMSHELHVLEMNDDLWDKVRGLGSETWKGLHVQWSFQTFLKTCS